jgi:hypothetical protein
MIRGDDPGYEFLDIAAGKLVIDFADYPQSMGSAGGQTLGKKRPCHRENCPGSVST